MTSRASTSETACQRTKKVRGSIAHGLAPANLDAAADGSRNVTLRISVVHTISQETLLRIRRPIPRYSVIIRFIDSLHLFNSRSTCGRLSLSHYFNGTTFSRCEPETGWSTQRSECGARRLSDLLPSCRDANSAHRRSNARIPGRRSIPLQRQQRAHGLRTCSVGA